MASSRLAEVLRDMSEQYDRDAALVLSSCRAEHQRLLDATRAELSRRATALRRTPNTAPNTLASSSSNSNNNNNNSNSNSNSRVETSASGKLTSIGSPLKSPALPSALHLSPEGITRESLGACIRQLYGETVGTAGEKGPRCVTKEGLALEIRRLYGL